MTRGNTFIERAGLDLEPMDPIDDGPGLPDVRARCEAIERHLVAQGDANEGEVVWGVYHLVYSGESGESIHAGLASVVPHLIEERDRWAIAVTRQQPGDGAGKVLWAATVLTMLARRVFQEFGIGTDELDEVASPIDRLAVHLNENPPQGEA